MNYNSYADLLLEKKALKIGSFTTKSGRNTPYFVNTGVLCDGESVSVGANLYAQKILQHFDLLGASVILFGPAYKGIPLVVSICQSLSLQHNTNSAYCFNRKEAKQHGESGSFIGSIPKKGDKVIIIEDVLTAGTSLKETHQTLDPIGCEVLGVVVGLDRQELGKQRLAKEEIEELFKVPLYSLTNIKELLEKNSALSQDKKS